LSKLEIIKLKLAVIIKTSFFYSKNFTYKKQLFVIEKMKTHYYLDRLFFP